MEEVSRMSLWPKGLRGTTYTITHQKGENQLETVRTHTASTASTRSEAEGTVGMTVATAEKARDAKAMMAAKERIFKDKERGDTVRMRYRY